MKTTFIIAVAGACAALAQTETKSVPAPMQVMISAGGEMGMSKNPVQGAPYSATMVNESVQTLADGNRIVQTNDGNIARDSLGRTRRDMPLPPLGNLSAANAPHMVIIQDPVAQTTYSLNLTDKTAHKMGLPPLPPLAPNLAQPGGFSTAGVVTAGIATAGIKMMATTGAAVRVPDALPPPGPIGTFFLSKSEPAETTSEDLGFQTMEGVPVQGVRTTRTIAAGEIGNDKPIDIVTEVWTSPDLKTVVYSKRSDPRMGDQTFRLTNIVRSEPDASLFTIPADFKVVDANQPGQDVIFYRSNQ